MQAQDTERQTGYEKAAAGEAWSVNAGIGVMDDGAVRVATEREAAGVQDYWIEKGYMPRRRA